MYNTAHNWRLACFTLNNNVYQSGTKLIYSGPCILNNNRIIVNNLLVSFMYYDGQYIYCNNGDTIYKFLNDEFKKNIVRIVTNEDLTQTSKSEVYWTDDMVAKTIWYILIMLAAVIFYDRVGIWILATIVWYSSTFKKK